MLWLILPNPLLFFEKEHYSGGLIYDVTRLHKILINVLWHAVLYEAIMITYRTRQMGKIVRPQGEDLDKIREGKKKSGRAKPENSHIVVMMLPFLLITWYLLLLKTYPSKYLFGPLPMIWHLNKFMPSISQHAFRKNSWFKEMLADVTWKRVLRSKKFGEY